MGVSKNNGTPRSSILIGFSIINHPFWGTFIFGNIHMVAWLIWLERSPIWGVVWCHAEGTLPALQLWWLTKLIFPLSKTTLHAALSLSKGCTTTQTYQPHNVNICKYYVNGRVDGSEILLTSWFLQEFHPSQLVFFHGSLPSIWFFLPGFPGVIFGRKLQVGELFSGFFRFL